MTHKIKYFGKEKKNVIYIYIYIEREREREREEERIKRRGKRNSQMNKKNEVF